MATSDKQNQLIALYADMAINGYNTIFNSRIEHAFNDMEIRSFAVPVKDILSRFKIETILDYGCGGSDYEAPGFDGALSAKEYFGLKQAYRFEPARNIDERQSVDAIVCFDVLEHVFIADVAHTIRELFSLADRLLIINVACYSARALLPNGENAHITVRPPLWWKAVFDTIAIEFPAVSVMLYCSVAWRKAEAFSIWSAADWLNSPTFIVS